MTEPTNNQKDFIEKVDRVINVFNSSIGIFVTISIIFGGVVTFSYLKHLNQSAIFPDVLASFSALSALLIVFFILSGLLFGTFFYIHFIPLPSTETESVNRTNHKIDVSTQTPESGKLNKKTISILSILVSALVVLWLISYKFEYGWIILLLCIAAILLFINFKEKIIKFIKEKGQAVLSEVNHKIQKSNWIKILFSWLLWLIVILLRCLMAFVLYYIYYIVVQCIVIIPLYLYLYFKYDDAVLILLTALMLYLFLRILWENYLSGDKLIRIENIWNLLLNICLVMLSLAFYTIIMFELIQGHPNSNMLFIIALGGWIVFYIFNGWAAQKIDERQPSFFGVRIGITSILVFMIMMFMNAIDKDAKIPQLILKPLHFIEYPSNANWYTIDTRFFAPNNLNNQEIERYSKDLLAYFYSDQPKTQCEHIADNDNRKKNECKKSEHSFQAQQKYNRFYGYVAWNLGDMKVFCPHGYEQARLEAQKEKKSNHIQCLALKSEYIIPYY